MISLGLTLFIGGVDFSANVISSKRKHEICKPGQALSLEMNPSIDHASILPWQDVTLDEQGVRVFTGYVTSVDARRAPNAVTIECNDTFKRVLCTLTDPGLMTDGESVLYWVDYLCTLAGIAYVIDADNADMVVVEDIPLELKMVSDCLFTIAAYAGWVIRIGPDGVLHFLNLASDVDQVLDTLEWVREQGDEDSRNECIIWGLGVDTKTVRVLPGVGLGRTMVFANPVITTTDLADYVAKFALDQYSSLDDILTISTLGNPNIQVGNIISVDLSGSNYVNTITDLQSEMNAGGYKLALTCGRKCLRMPAMMTSGSLDVYVGTDTFLARSSNFYTSGSTTWQDVTPNYTSGSVTNYYSGFESFSLDRFVTRNGYSSGSFGIVRSTKLYRANPTWEQTVSPAQFQSATGANLLTVANIMSSPKQWGLVWSEAVSSVGGVYIGRSTTSGSLWSWSSSVDTLMSSEYTGGITNLGFFIDDSNNLYFGGGNGKVWRSSGSSMSFTNVYTVSGASTTVNNIASSGSSIIFIGGKISSGIPSGPTPSGDALYASTYGYTDSVSDPSYAMGAPNYTFATFGSISPQSVMNNIDRPIGSRSTSGSMYLRFWSSSLSSGSIRASLSALTPITVPFSGIQRPTPWSLVTVGSSTALSLALTSGSVGIDAIEFMPQTSPMVYRNGTITPSGSWTGDGLWGWDTNATNQHITFFVDNVPFGYTIDVSITCVYERLPIPNPPYYSDLIDIATGNTTGGLWPALNSGETRVYSLSTNIDGSLGFDFYQGLARTGCSYRIDYVKVNGETIFAQSGGTAEYIKKVSSGSSTDVTPSQGGAIGLRCLSMSKISPSMVYAIPSSGSSGIVRSLANGSSWSVVSSGYAGANNITQSVFNSSKVYWLDNDGIYYSGDGLATAREVKTGNWQSVYGSAFTYSGKKIIILPRAVK
jgi:hypothetical protein